MGNPISIQKINEAVDLIRSGRLVAFPTETVYGLAGDATNSDAVAAIFRIKGRPSFNPLIIHVCSLAEAEKLVIFNGVARSLAENFWPGALTLILPRRKDCPVSFLAGSGLETLAVRIPKNEIALKFLQTVELPIAAPSANKSGSVSPTKAEHVLDSLGASIDLILDGGACQVGIESTIIDLSTNNPCVLRTGGVPIENLVRQLENIQIVKGDDHSPKAPGMLSRHYATTIPLRMNAEDVYDGEALLAFGGRTLGPAVAVANLSRAGDVNEAAANLFDMMRRLDKPEYKGIAVMKVPKIGLGVAINDRLQRACH